MLRKLWLRPILLFFCLIVFSGCSSDEQQPPRNESKPQKELLIFCGLTMIDPVRELMTRFEQEAGVKMTMSYGGSADLMQSIKINRVGDLYFPGGESFITEADKANLLKERKQVGVNQAALFVQKGNPKGLTGDLDELTKPGLQVGIGHPELGSIGKETKRILEAKGIYNQVVAAAAMMQPDSKALTGVLREGKVDVVLNWKAVHSLRDNQQHMDLVPIKGDFAVPHKLTMAIVSYSREPELAARFLDFCTSEAGKSVFTRYGF